MMIKLALISLLLLSSFTEPGHPINKLILPSSGALSFSAIATEINVTGSKALSNLYSQSGLSTTHPLSVGAFHGYSYTHAVHITVSGSGSSGSSSGTVTSSEAVNAPVTVSIEVDDDNGHSFFQDVVLGTGTTSQSWSQSLGGLNNFTSVSIVTISPTTSGTQAYVTP